MAVRSAVQREGMEIQESSGAISVSALVGLMQELVEDNFVDVWVQGEISNLSFPASGHCYFTLKDNKAQIRCAMFRAQARGVTFRPENGMAVLCRGRVSVYPQRGDVQLIAEQLEPVGVGRLQLAFEQLRDKLQQEGLFSAARKRALPQYPLVIGVVTSPSGAAIQDILNILRRRSAGVSVLLRPVRVQGEGAAEEIAAAIAELNAEGSSQVMIVGRGGGSREDLWAFNEEVVARAIAASAIPVISAVGHEVDFSIADMVADLRAPTPSAAAELVVQNRLELERHLDQLCIRLGGLMKARLNLYQSRLEGLEKRLRPPQERIRLMQLQLRQLRERLGQAMDKRLTGKQQQLATLAARLDSLSPLAVLGRGYAIVKKETDGQVVSSAEQVETGDALRIVFARGEVSATVCERECAAK